MKTIIRAIQGWNQRRLYRQTKRWMEKRCNAAQRRHIMVLATVIK